MTKKPKSSPAKPAAKKNRKEDQGSSMLAATIVDAIEEKKGENIRCLDLRNIPNAVCDFFIICDAQSRTQVDAIADSVIDEVKKKTGQRPFHSEGFENSEWILVDYVNIVVHVFQKEIRSFYNLESLWADAETTEPVKEKKEPKTKKKNERRRKTK